MGQDDETLDRRGFFRLCASTAAVVTASRRLLAEDLPGARAHQRVRLVDGRDRPLRSTDLRAGENYLFHYPYLATPCFIVDAGTALVGAPRQRLLPSERPPAIRSVGPRLPGRAARFGAQRAA